MPMHIQNRITNPRNLDRDYITRELGDGKHVIVQFDEAHYTENQLFELNELCKTNGKNLGIRFYGHYGGSFDCKTLINIPQVKCLYVDCLLKAENVNTISELDSLQKLSLGIYELKETEILNSKNLRAVSELILTDTKTKALNLGYLDGYKNLQFLIIGGHTKNIEVVGGLSNLDYLSLNSIKKTKVSFINRLEKLKTLKFILGSRENINEIEDNEIENLDVVWVRGFNDLGNIHKFKNLRELLIEDNIQLKSLHFSDEIPKLNKLKILNCKSFKSLTGLENLSSLKELIIYKTNLEFGDIATQKLPISLRFMSFCTTRKKVDEDIKRKILEMGYDTR